MEEIRKENLLAFCKGAKLDDNAVVPEDWRRGWNDALAAIVWFVTGGEGSAND